MFSLPRPIFRLIEAFERLPGIGPKTAARLTFYLLHVPQIELEKFAQSLVNLKKNTVECGICFNVTESDPCEICSNPGRNQTMICVAEQPLDVMQIERTGKYNGVYHVLHGAINPLQNIGPDEIRINELIKRVKYHISSIKEIILATNPNMEGEATAMFIQKQLSAISLQLSAKFKITRLAHGLPVGGDLEYADEVTLSRALEGRREF